MQIAVMWRGKQSTPVTLLLCYCLFFADCLFFLINFVLFFQNTIFVNATDGCDILET